MNTKFKDRKWLGHITFKNGKMEQVQGSPLPNVTAPCSYTECLQKAKVGKPSGLPAFIYLGKLHGSVSSDGENRTEGAGTIPVIAIDHLASLLARLANGIKLQSLSEGIAIE